jgi:glycosyltransferase involved in cell wall biosynthesis
VTYVTISYARRRELAAYLSLPLEEVRVITPPVNAGEWLALGDETNHLLARVRLDLADPLVLVPCKLLPHKNLAAVIPVAEALRRRRPGARVVITGAVSPHQELSSQLVRSELGRAIERSGLQECVTLAVDALGCAPKRRTVRELMLLADLVFLPSTEEGYGMPIRESALLRVPVLCADIPSFREAGGDAATYFQLDECPEVIANKVQALVSTPANRLRREVLRSWEDFQEAIAELAGLEGKRHVHVRGNG